MRVLQFHKIGIHFDTIERFHIHRQAAITTLMMITPYLLTESSIPYLETSKMNLNKTPHPPTQPLPTPYPTLLYPIKYPTLPFPISRPLPALCTQHLITTDRKHAKIVLTSEIFATLQGLFLRTQMADILLLHCFTHK